MIREEKKCVKYKQRGRRLTGIEYQKAGMLTNWVMLDCNRSPKQQ